MTEMDLLKQIIAAMATKEDLEKMANKEELAKVDVKIDKALNALTILQSEVSYTQEVQNDVNERILEALSRIESNSIRLEGKIDKISLKVSTHDAKLRNVK